MKSSRKPLSLEPLNFEEAVSAFLKVKPESKKKKLSKKKG
jgi:hypothetical protein